MAVVIVGAKGGTWTAADWIARNALVFLRPALERTGLPSCLERFGTPGDTPPAFVDLSGLLELPGAAAQWERAVAATLAAIDAEAGSGWSEPQRFAAFRASVAALMELGESDGNVLVQRLADEASKIFRADP